MLKSTTRDLSNISYTNKDFQTIYPELLELTKKLSYKWDPSISDESDPGVVLLKLAALMADKNNYNIDKNILELYPLSVTQEPNARQLFDQLGYTMRYYESATTQVEFAVINPPEPKDSDLENLGLIEAPDTWDWTKEHKMTYKIPRFTMLSNSDNSLIYTLTKDVLVSSDGVRVSGDIIQGTANTYAINGNTLITPNELDYNNRIYFTETDIAQNGIFIISRNNEYLTWKRVDNLLIQELGTYCYKFGLTEDGKRCYIEFPSDIDTLIGAGISITYIRTAGLEGNIGRKKLTQFYLDTTIDYYLEKTPSNTTSTVVTNENIYITNPNAAINGRNPETIEEAYKNYQRVKTTFNTLVTCNDYTNFMISNENVSNGYVCDRTNDIQSSYKILDTKNNNILSTHVKSRDTNKDEMNAFNLRVYALSYIDTVDNPLKFIDTFRLLTYETSTVTDMYNLLYSPDNGWGSLKTISHDFINPEPNRPLMFKNKYILDIKVIPQFIVTNLQEDEIRNNIRTSLYKILNSKELSFGESPDYSVIFDTIVESDSRIKALILQDLEYETYAVYKEKSSGLIKELRIDDLSTQPTVGTEEHDLWEIFRQDIFIKSVLSGKTQFLVKDSQFDHSFQEANSKLKTDITHVTTDTNVEVSWDYTKEASLQGAAISRKLEPNENLILSAVNLIDDVPYSTYVKVLYNLNINPEFTKFETIDENPDIVIVTQDVSKGSIGFIYPALQEYNVLYKNGTSENTEWDEISAAGSKHDNLAVDYDGKIKYYTNKTESITYNPTAINKNTDYTLTGDDECIIFFWSDDENGETYKYKRYRKSSEINTFNPSFKLTYQPNVSFTFDGETKFENTPVSQILEQLNTAFGDKDEGILRSGDLSSQFSYNNKSCDIYSFVKSLAGSSYVLTGTNQITTKKLNKIHINNTSGTGTDKIYWVLNHRKNENGHVKYVLFESTPIDKPLSVNDPLTESYILQDGEYLIYGNNAETQLNILSSGTKIERERTTDVTLWPEWSVPAVPYEEFIGDPFTELDGKWYITEALIKLYATEQQWYQVGPGYQLQLRPIQKNKYKSIKFSNRKCEKIGVDDKDTITVNLGSKESNLSNYAITLIDLETTTTNTELPIRNYEPYGWTVKTLLNLDCSSSSPQTITEYQSIKFYAKEPDLDIDEEDPVLVLPYSANKDIKTKLLTNRELSLTGGHLIDTTYLSLTDGKTSIPLDVYSYEVSHKDDLITDKLSRQNDKWEYVLPELNTNVEISLPGHSSNDPDNFSPGNINLYSYLLPVRLPLGRYLIPIDITQNTLTNFKLAICAVTEDDPINSVTGELTKALTLHSINGESYNSLGSYSLLMDLEQLKSEAGISDDDIIDGLISFYVYPIFNTRSPANHTPEHDYIEGELSATNPDAYASSLTIGAPYKYIPSEYIPDGVSVESILPLMNEYNRSNNNSMIFDYTYQVPDSDKIENPLSAKSFLNENHPYNRFTIAEWNIEDSAPNKLIIETRIK